MNKLENAIRKLRLYPIEERGIDHCNYINAEDGSAILQALEWGEKAK